MAEAPRWLVLGLGNPGERYVGTRHNVGFRVLDELAALAGGRFDREEPVGRLALQARVSLAGGSCALAKPRTYMNRSGRAARALLEQHGLCVAQMLVVHDDADLELGRLRLRSGGGAGGHNGIRSLLDVLGEDGFLRLRLGVRGTERERRELVDYVLEPFDPSELPRVRAMIARAVSAVQSVLAEGLESAMNRFNRRPDEPAEVDENADRR